MPRFILAAMGWCHFAQLGFGAFIAALAVGCSDNGGAGGTPDGQAPEAAAQSGAGEAGRSPYADASSDAADATLDASGLADAAVADAADATVDAADEGIADNVDAGPDAADSGAATGPDAADGGVPPVTVFVTDGRSPLSGINVVFHDPSGVQLAIVQTDATGHASDVVPAGSFVTFVLGTPETVEGLVTIAGVMPGDVLPMVQNLSPTRPIIGTANVELPSASVPRARPPSRRSWAMGARRRTRAAPRRSPSPRLA
jgi:hypothetical protein